MQKGTTLGFEMRGELLGQITRVFDGRVVLDIDRVLELLREGRLHLANFFAWQKLDFMSAFLNQRMIALHAFQALIGLEHLQDSVPNNHVFALCVRNQFVVGGHRMFEKGGLRLRIGENFLG